MDERSITRNIGISAHIDSGKTTLTERILFYCGNIHKIEEVRGGGDGATMDHMELEKEKGITITSAATTVHWKDTKINIIDTPGHVDFTVEVERSLRVLDGAILVLCAVSGVQSQSITVDRQMKRYRVPRLAFINKMDRTGSNPFKVSEDLRDKLNLNSVLMQIPIGAEENTEGVVDLVAMKAYYFDGDNGETVRVEEIPAELKEQAELQRMEMLDAVSMFDEQMMEDLLEEKEISEETIHAAVKKGVLDLELCPVFMGTAFKNKGVQPLLDAVARYLPSPLECEKPTASPTEDPETTVELDPDPSKDLVAMAFKITDDQFGQLTYTRVYQGTLEKGTTITNARTGKRERVGRLVRMHSDAKVNIDAAHAGDIIAMVGVDCASGDTFCSGDTSVSLESIFAPEPVISFSISCSDSKDVDNLGKALQRFIKEDPTFHVHTDEESGETIISGMGELHLEIYVERMQREYGANVKVGPPQVNYRECISADVKFNYTHKKQSGGSGQFASISGDLEPMDPNDAGSTTMEFNDFIKGGNIPSEFIPSVEKGFNDAMAEGPLAAFPVVGVRANLRDGKYHDVDSSDMAFRLCARTAMKKAILQGEPKLLEPIMSVEIESPEEYQGSIVGDVSSRRGVINGMATRDNICVVNASVPLSEMFGYSTAVRSLSAGKAGYSMEFEKYAETPRNIQEDVCKKRKEKVKIGDE